MVKKTTEKTTETPVKKELVVKDVYYLGVGRRREAVARVQLSVEGDKSISVNGMPVEKYFQGEIAKYTYLEPLKATNNLNRFTISVKVNGSGQKGQLGAMVHGIARALLKVDEEKYRSILRKKGLVTRDPRTRERRKVGLGGKARREKQSPKR